MTKREREKKQRLIAKQWHYLALVVGYNELAKHKENTLGELTYLRMGRDHAEAEYTRLGGAGSIDRSAKPIAILTDRPLHIVFTEKDIELMRAAVAEYDAK